MNYTQNPKGRPVDVIPVQIPVVPDRSAVLCINFLRKGGIAAVIDAEHALDPEYAKNLGVNIDELLISQPDTGEQALDIAEELAELQKNSLMYTMATRRMSNIITQMKTVINVGK